MNTKILMSVLVIGLTAMAVGGAMTGAFFSDTEESTGNTFTAGTLDLTPDTSAAFVSGLTNLAPGVDNVAQSITVFNSGTIDGAQMDLSISITGEADGNNPKSPDASGNDMSDTEYAEALKVETLTWEANNLLSGISDTNSDGNTYIDLKEVANADLSDQVGLTADEKEKLRLDVTLDPTDKYSNAPQGDGVVIKVVFDLSQVAD